MSHMHKYTPVAQDRLPSEQGAESFASCTAHSAVFGDGEEEDERDTSPRTDGQTGGLAGGQTGSVTGDLIAPQTGHGKCDTSKPCSKPGQVKQAHLV